MVQLAVNILMAIYCYIVVDLNGHCIHFTIYFPSMFTSSSLPNDKYSGIFGFNRTSHFSMPIISRVWPEGRYLDTDLH